MTKKNNKDDSKIKLYRVPKKDGSGRGMRLNYKRNPACR